MPFFRVRVGDQFSDRLLQGNGVPQGAVLGVALFGLMINDVGCSLSRSVRHSLFVDDLAIWCTTASSAFLTRQLQLAVIRLGRWPRLTDYVCILPPSVFTTGLLQLYRGPRWLDLPTALVSVAGSIS